MGLKPYYELDGVTLYHGDFREVLPALGVFDCCVTDPPYGETSLKWDRWVDGWPGLVLPALAPHGSLWCFGSLRMFLGHAADFAGWALVQDVVWEKHNGSSFHADRFKRVHENALQWRPASAAWSGIYKAPVYTQDATKRTVRRKERPPHTGEIADSTYTSHDGGPKLMRSVIPVRSCHGSADHPTQKPGGILRPLIEYSCPSGGVVLDVFAGAGSTLLAARQLGRCAVGIEVDEQYCDATARRLMQAEMVFA
jgi:site-specific DNA-methyltransferase (adenine-specific)